MLTQSLANTLFPSGITQLQALGNSLGVAVALWVVVVFLGRRFGIVYYGSEQTSNMGLAYLGLLTLPFVFAPHKLVTFGAVLLLDIWLEKIFSTLGREKHIFSSFDQGVFLGLLALLHPAFILIVITYLFLQHYYHNSHKRNVSAFMLGICTIFWVIGLLFMPPNLGYLVQWVTQWSATLLSPSLVRTEAVQWYILFTTGFITCYNSVQVYNFQSRALEKHRAHSTGHLCLVWVLFVLYLLFNKEFFLLPLVYFQAVFMQLFSKVNPKPLHQLLILFPLLILTALLLYHYFPIL